MTLLQYEGLIKEGLATLVIPRLDYYRRVDGVVEPAWMPVFYNPQAVLSRDFTSMFLIYAMKRKEFFFVDALSGTGVRGIRIALEAGGVGIINDVDPRAHYYMVKNTKLNGLEGRIEVYNSEANALLNNLVLTGMVVDYVDIDPYGSPSPHIDSALKPLAKEAYVGITATDTGTLSCSYPYKALIRYWSNCVKLDFEKEFAIRLLISNVVLRGGALEIGLEPLLSLAYKFYVRVFFKTTRSAKQARRLVEECIGYLWYCPNTLERGFTSDINIPDAQCSDGTKPILMGRIWTCNIQNYEVASYIAHLAQKLDWVSEESKIVSSLIALESSINAPYYRLDKLCSTLKLNMPSPTIVVNKLAELGYKSSRTHMDPRGVKTNAPHSVLVEVIRELVGKR
jgi:tRNA (guanine26-N2/guanine27-N2)-dimethyltransferase